MASMVLDKQDREEYATYRTLDILFLDGQRETVFISVKKFECLATDNHSTNKRNKYKETTSTDNNYIGDNFSKMVRYVTVTSPAEGSGPLLSSALALEFAKLQEIGHHCRHQR